MAATSGAYSKLMRFTKFGERSINSSLSTCRVLRCASIVVCSFHTTASPATTRTLSSTPASARLFI